MNTAEEKKLVRKEDLNHNVIMENRHKMSISGVYDVDSFDEKEIVLFTSEGVLSVAGEDLHINRLNVETGDILVEGEIYSVNYSDEEYQKKGLSFFSRLFK